MRVYVLDTTSLLLIHIPNNSVTCNHVLGEVVNSRVRRLIEGLKEGGVLKVFEPDDVYVNHIVKLSREWGEFEKLSIADIHVLSLAYQLRDAGEDVTVLTDDYSIQNILSHLGISYKVLRRGIKKRVKWLIRCRACGAVFDSVPPSGVCPFCGGEVGRKPIT